VCVTDQMDFFHESSLLCSVIVTLYRKTERFARGIWKFF
jgi:hypothetical protein